jgi:pSer/pThr/pTyr-binding forkhead associated (FHA) protein
MTSVCERCGYDNPLGARFCMSCGEAIDAAPSGAERTASYDPAVDTGQFALDEENLDAVAMLVVQRGPKRGSRIALDDDIITVGRHPESDIFLDDVTVSRRHAELRKVGPGFEVVDVGSLNGTYVNKDRVEKALLSNGDELQIGKFKLVYVSLGLG